MSAFSSHVGSRIFQLLPALASVMGLLLAWAGGATTARAADQPLLLRFAEPLPGAFQMMGRPVTFTLIAEGEPGPTSVNVWSPLGFNVTLTESPYSFAWANLQPGVWPVTARASWGGTSVTTQVMVTILPPGGQPLIIQEPQSAIAVPGTDIVFQVSAVSLSPVLQYQWRFHGTNLPGATNASLEVSDVVASRAGPYSVVARNPSGQTPSLTAWLTVTTGGSQVAFSGSGIRSPSDDQLLDSTYLAELWAGPSPDELSQIGEPTRLNSGSWDGGVRDVPTVPAGAPVYCEVRFRSQFLSSWSLLFSNLRPYPGPLVSLEQLFAVPDGWRLPSLTAKSCSPNSLAVGADIVATVGNDVRLCMSGLSGIPAVYQWRKDGVPIPSTTLVYPDPFYEVIETSVEFSNVQAAHAGCYTVVGSNAQDVRVSAPIRLFVRTPPFFNSFSLSTNALVGTALPLKVGVAGFPPFTYQWRRDGVVLPTATQAELLLYPLTAADAGNYDVTVGTEAGPITSPICRVDVDLRGWPRITRQPSSVSTYLHMSTFLKVEASGVRPISYQWFRGDTPVGQNADALTFDALTVEDAGSYRAVLRNQFGAVTSEVATVTVITNPPVISGLPERLSLHLGMNARLEALIENPERVTYAWYHDGVRLSGEIFSSYFVQAQQPSDAGIYSVVVRAGSLFATGQTVVEIRLDPHLGVREAQELHFFSGKEVTLCANTPFNDVYGSPPFHFQWLRNGQPVPGGTEDCLTTRELAGPAAPVVPVEYSLVVSNNYGTDRAPRFRLYSYPAPVVRISPGPVVPVGATVTYQAVAPGPVHIYLWGNPGFFGGGPEFVLTNVPAGPLDSYQVTVYYDAPLSTEVVVQAPRVDVVPNVVLQITDQLGLRQLRVLTGTLTSNVQIEGSTDLQHWEAVGTVTTVNGEGFFSEPLPADWSHRFFRASHGLP